MTNPLQMSDSVITGIIEEPQYVKYICFGVLQYICLHKDGSDLFLILPAGGVHGHDEGRQIGDEDGVEAGAQCHAQYDDPCLLDAGDGRLGAIANADHVGQSPPK